MKTEIHILIVDDNRENLKVVSSFLKEKDYKIALAMNGFDALRILGENQIDLVLLDVMMPEMDGFETCLKIKSEPRNADLPVVFLTAKNDTGDIEKGYEIGGSDYLSKPFRKTELFIKVKQHIELKLAKDFIKSVLKNMDIKGLCMIDMLDIMDKRIGGVKG